MPTDKRPLDSSWVKQQALEFGFHLVGITTPDPPIHMDVYRAWIEFGRQADMAYLSRPDAVEAGQIRRSSWRTVDQSS